MRRPTKFRIAYLVTILVTYVAGFQLIPETLANPFEWSVFSAFALGYFLVIPLLYWLWVIKIGQQKAWKIIIPFSMSGLIARFSFPAEFAQYFEFITWAKYPILVVIFALEVFVIVSVVKALWQARKLSGDPRVNIVSRIGNQQEDEKKLMIALMLAYEPSSWFYFIPRFSRNHPASLANISLLSAKTWHIAAILFLLIGLTALVYLGLVQYSEIAAILVSGFVFYGLVILCANYRLSRHYSLYLHQDNLVINNSMWGLAVCPIQQIDKTQQGCWNKIDHPEAMMIGRGQSANIKITFAQPQFYYSNMGQHKEQTSCLYLNVDNPQDLVLALENLKPK